MALPALETVQIPIEAVKEEELIPEANDRAIMIAAIASKVDVVLIGDKAFLELV